MRAYWIGFHQYPVQWAWLLTFYVFTTRRGLLLGINNSMIVWPSVCYTEECLIILRFTRLYIRFVHLLSNRGENQLMLRIIHIEYWIPRLKNLVRYIIHRCKTCTLFRKHFSIQIMVTLPPERTTIARPLTITDVDYAGSFDIKAFQDRSGKLLKGFVCVIVWFYIKAIHLGATTDLYTNAFLASYQRFIARRGYPLTIFSNNDTNFVSATRDCRIVLQQSRLPVKSVQSSQNLSWKFIPAGAAIWVGFKKRPWEASRYIFFESIH